MKKEQTKTQPLRFPPFERYSYLFLSREPDDRIVVVLPSKDSYILDVRDIELFFNRIGLREDFVCKLLGYLLTWDRVYLNLQDMVYRYLTQEEYDDLTGISSDPGLLYPVSGESQQGSIDFENLWRPMAPPVLEGR